jgi:hypothetical protein
MPEAAVPIVNIEIIGGEEPTASTVQRLADEMGEVFNSGPGRTWIKIRRLSEAGYAENRRPGAARDYAPVFVDVARSGRSRNQVAEARALAAIVAVLLERDRRHIHVKYEAPLAGRIAFGGELEEG